MSGDDFTPADGDRELHRSNVRFIALALLIMVCCVGLGYCLGLLAQFPRVDEYPCRPSAPAPSPDDGDGAPHIVHPTYRHEMSS